MVKSCNTRSATNASEEFIYHLYKTLVNVLVVKAKASKLKCLTHPQFLLGFTELQIAQVLYHCDVLFSLQDICEKVEI